MKKKAIFEPQVDLLEIRRELISMRSRHSHDLRVTERINALIGKLAHLSQPVDNIHEQRLIKMIADTRRAIDQLTAGNQSDG